MSTTQSQPREDVEPFIRQTLRENRLNKIFTRIRKHLRENTGHIGINQSVEEIQLELKALPNASMIVEDALEGYARIAARAIEHIEEYTTNE